MTLRLPVVQSIEAILFDMNGTLRVREPHEPTQYKATQRILELLGKKEIPDSAWEEMTRRKEEYNQWAQEQLIQLSEGEIWTRWILPEYPPEQIGPVAPELSLAWSERKGHTVPKAGAQQTLTELKGRGYRLGIISNSMSSLDIPHSLEVYGWKDYFKSVVLSSSIGIRKPAPEIFWEATRLLGVHPSHCAYLGNRISRDMVGCKQAGFALGIIMETTGKPGTYEQVQTIQPDVSIHFLSDLLDIFPVRIPLETKVK
jgi:putative hydrolase of the HAD superfamily